MIDLTKKFAKLYDDHVDKIYRFIYLKVESQQAAEDLTSQVFTKGWARFRVGEDIKNPSAYLYQIARTEISNHYRYKSKYQTVSLEKIELAEGNIGLEDKHKQDSDIEQVKKVLKKLDEDEQNVLIMRYLDEQPIATIALALEKSEGAVRVMLHRALKEVKEAIK
jgi:RNA polymerase sigma-70 factor (ECF subfamily)